MNPHRGIQINELGCGTYDMPSKRPSVGVDDSIYPALFTVAGAALRLFCFLLGHKTRRVIVRGASVTACARCGSTGNG